MIRYIALLRGINVGGKNKISMAELKAVFEEQGFQNVSTYINSGNVIFSTEQKQSELAQMCEGAIANAFGFDIRVAVYSASELIDWLSHAPSWWNKDENSKHNAVFVIPPAEAEDVIALISDKKPEYGLIDVCGQLIFWSAPLETFSKTRLTKIVHTSLSDTITVRNARTTHKLAAFGKEG